MITKAIEMYVNCPLTIRFHGDMRNDAKSAILAGPSVDDSKSEFFEFACTFEALIPYIVSFQKMY